MVIVIGIASNLRRGATHKFTAWAQHFVFFVILFNLAIIMVILWLRPPVKKAQKLLLKKYVRMIITPFKRSWL